jgi:hypothetical protein
MEFKPLMAESFEIGECYEYKLNFHKKPVSLMVCLRDKDGKEKPVILKDYIIKPVGKAKIAKGDILNYVAVF